MIGWQLWRDFFRSYVQSARVGTAGSIEGARVTIICFLWVFFGVASCFGNLLCRHAHKIQCIREDAVHQLSILAQPVGLRFLFPNKSAYFFFQFSWLCLCEVSVTRLLNSSLSPCFVDCTRCVVSFTMSIKM